jgi:hypothetical protein
MIRIHPNVGRGVVAALTLLIGVTGCRSQQSGLANPFLAPNRIPPPATRAILPGQAQPYYPGDPLPVMQSGAPQSMGAVAANPASSQPIPSADSELAWGSPSKQAVAVSPPPRAFAAGNEPIVAIPNDTGALRFDLPPSAPSAGTMASMSAGNGTPATASSPPNTMSSPAANQGVVQASYAQPIANPVKPNAPEQPTYSITQAPTSPWRSPQIAPPATLAANAAPSNSAWGPVLQQMPVPAPPSWLPNPTPYGSYANSQNVQLRAVASPPPAPGEPMPRIRFPGYTTTAQNVSAADGFRPRSSMK